MEEGKLRKRKKTKPLGRLPPAAIIKFTSVQCGLPPLNTKPPTPPPQSHICRGLLTSLLLPSYPSPTRPPWSLLSKPLSFTDE